VLFDQRSPYGLYNWELFLHVPVLIAEHLSRQQRFTEAQQWLRLVFDPTDDEARATPTLDPTRFWRFLPFRQEGRPDRIEDLLKWLANPDEKHPGEQDFADQIELWKENPFRPHEVARVRSGAYQWDVLFAYLDNLLAWGDDRFRRDTRESLVEATMLYVQAAQILGPRPRRVEPQLQPPALSYRSVFNRWDDFSNVWYTLADSPLVTGSLPRSTADGQAAALGNIGMTYFGVPHNPKLLEYWNRVEDRLFKIRHCQNLDGVARELPLFEPPIDPDLLVRAVAAGVSIEAALADLQGTVSQYRYTALAQKASELCGEVRALGAAILAVLEKKNAEQLAKLRSGQEASLLELVTEIRRRQVDEAEANVAVLAASRAAVASRFRHLQYLLTGQQVSEPAVDTPVAEDPPKLVLVSSADLAGDEQGLGLVQSERNQLASLSNVGFYAIRAGISNALAAVMFAIGSYPTTQPVQGLGHGFNAAASLLNTLSADASHQAGREGLLAGYQRRRDDWTFQGNNVRRELAQIDQQLAAARIRVAIAKRELDNHQTQVANARDVEQFLRDKYTNEQLYTWMSGEVGAVYFATYQLALDMAKQAERALRYELGRPGASFIQPRYWDGLHKGLMAGERLALDLRRMDAAYMEGNRREHELTRNVSLLRLDPVALVRLRATGVCEFHLPEVLFDIDAPGHYLRRLKSVGVSLPCVAGPYSGVHARLTLLRTTVRHRPDLTSDDAKGYLPTEEDSRFVDDFGLAETVMTSGTVEATGTWEPSLRDERRLPFEGRGAISWWRLELPAEFRPFDYDTISDVILHIRYSARDGGQQLRNAAAGAASGQLGDPEQTPQALLVSLRHEFPSQWARLGAPGDGTRSETITIARDRFPYLVAGRTSPITVTHVDMFGAAHGDAGQPALPSLAIGGTAIALQDQADIGTVAHRRSDPLDWTVPAASTDPGAVWKVTASAATLQALRDVILVATYKVGSPGA
jgi:hypothetical protein